MEWKSLMESRSSSVTSMWGRSIYSVLAVMSIFLMVAVLGPVWELEHFITSLNSFI